MDIILCGDFNLDLLKVDVNASSSEFLDTMNSLSVLPVITKSTRIADDSCTLIANILISNLLNFQTGNLTLTLLIISLFCQCMKIIFSITNPGIR